jgi:hypothetical protein
MDRAIKRELRWRGWQLGQEFNGTWIASHPTLGDLVAPTLKDLLRKADGRNEEARSELPPPPAEVEFLIPRNLLLNRLGALIADAKEKADKAFLGDGGTHRRADLHGRWAALSELYAEIKHSAHWGGSR